VAFGEKTKAKSSGSSSKTHSSRGRSVREKPKKKFAAYIFWLFFFILIICLFIANMDAIRTSLHNTGIVDHLLNRSAPGRNVLPLFPETGDDTPETLVSVPPAGSGETSRGSEPSAPDPDAIPRALPESGIPSDSDVPLSETPSAAPPVETPAGRTGPPAVPRESAQPAARQQPQIPVETRRERVLYFIQVDPDGTIVRTKVTRNLPVTDTPMVDVLNILLQGPSAEENSRGLISLIPKGTLILEAFVRGSTAYINFNENFLFNEYGVEGYAGQLRQIVWTITEFSNIKDVQILIDGRRRDYLGESIWIGSPVGRESR
jgi:spore germination protein GerM